MYRLLFIHWDPDVVALTLGPLEIRWYSLCWCIGLLSVYMLMHRLFKQQKLSEQQFEPMFLYSFLGILIGARLGHCLLYEPQYFLSSPTHLLEMILPIRYLPDHSWHFTGYQGLASHGGTVGLTLALWLYSRKVHLPLLHVLDNVAIVTPLCACAIRIGNLMNSEIIGRPTNLPFAFIFQQVDTLPRHPGQLYEAICYLLIFIIQWRIYKKSFQVSEGSTPPVGRGYYFGLCLLLIFTARLLIEFTKADQEAWESGMLLNMGQLLSIPFIIAGAYFMYKARKNKKSSE